MTSDLATFLADVGKSQLGWPESLRFTYDKTRELLANGVQGDLVECGVAAGVHPAAMWRACHDAGETRSIRLFDSFEGLPHGSSKDGLDWNSHWGDGSGRLEPSGVAVATLESVRANLARWGCDGETFSFFVGWFERVLPPVASAWRARYEAGEAEGIAFLRLDGDLYASTKVCLEALYPLVVPGGVVVVDDWNLEGCRAAVKDYFESLSVPKRTMPNWSPTPITESGDVWWTKP